MKQLIVVLLLLLIVCIEEKLCGQHGNVYYPCELQREKVVEEQNFQWTTIKNTYDKWSVNKHER